MIATANRAKEIFVELIANHPPEQWHDRLAAICGIDNDLRRRVESLLAAHRQHDSFLLRPADPALETVERPMSERPGTMIGPYKLLEQIGEGGMGVVYVAEQTEPVRRRVALKIIKPGMDTKQVIARFEAERQALAMMDHPNIAKILDAGSTGPSTKSEAGTTAVGGRTKRIQSTKLQAQDDEAAPVSDIGASNLEFVSDFALRASDLTAGRPYFVMELVHGMPITDYCDKAKLDPRKRLELFIDVCHAVQHAHQKGIIHRDIKPTNVMVTLHDGTPVVKVIDFGVAKAMHGTLARSASEGNTLYTAFNQLVGTPLYMSPEQAELSGLDIDTRSDVYSLGVLLYELLTGTTPFDKERLQSAGFDEMRRIIREEEPETVSTRLAKTRSEKPGVVARVTGVAARVNRRAHAALPELDWIVSRSLEKDRSRRYESASALAADIHRYLADEPVQACPPSTIYRFRKFARKHKAAFTTAAIIAASLLLGTTVSAWQAIRATQAEAQATANAEQATANESKAKHEEQKAIALAASEATQRKQAEKNFDAALEAVDQMLANVNDEDLNDVPRVGPLRRKMLKDSIAFYDRILLKVEVSAKTRLKVAQTWERVGHQSFDLDELEQGRLAYKTAIDILTQLVAEHPDQAIFLSNLARIQQNAGSKYYHMHDHEGAKDLFRNSSDCFVVLSTKEPKNKSWLIRQGHALRGLANTLYSLGERKESMSCARRALNLFELSETATGYDRGKVLQSMAVFRAADAPAESDELFRRAIAEHRDYLPNRKTEQERAEFAALVQDAASTFEQRHPIEAEQLRDEAIALWREIVVVSPNPRAYWVKLAQTLRNQAGHLRRIAADGTSGTDSAIVTARLAKADSLAKEAIGIQRRTASKFALAADRNELVKLLQEESECILRDVGRTRLMDDEEVAARQLRADALLTEAIQLCRALAAEFPDSADYKNRLAALLNLQAQHFGPTKEGDQ